MNTSDRSDANDHVHDIANERTPGAPGRLAQRLPLILGLWIVISAPLIYVVHSRTEPKYEAFSTLRIEPTKPELFGPAIRDPGRDNFQPYMETQRNLILTDRVLDAALADRAVQSFPMLKETDTADPKVELRKSLHVDIVPDTYLIRVSTTSEDRNEAYAVVKAVVDAFIQQHREFNLGDTGLLKVQYESFIKAQRETLEIKKGELLKLAEKEDQAAQEKSDTRKPPSRVDEIKATFLKEEINSLTGNIRIVEQKLEQLKFESSNQLVRVFLQDPASPPKTPKSNDRGVYMTLVPIVTLLVLVGLFYSFDATRRQGKDRAVPEL